MGPLAFSNHSPHNIRYFSKSEAAIAKILNGTHSVESATHYSPSLRVIYRQNRQNNVQHFVCPYHWLKKTKPYFSLTSVVSKIQHCVSLFAIKTKKLNGIEHPSKKPSSSRKWPSAIGEAWKDSSVMAVIELFETGHFTYKIVEFNKFSMKQVWKAKEKASLMLTLKQNIIRNKILK